MERRSGSGGFKIVRFEKVEGVKGVHALFLGELDSGNRKKLYAKLSGQPVLTIGDEKGLAGGDTCIASFFLAEGKVNFEVSTKAIKRAGLSISSQLLKLADIVEKR